MQRNVGKFGISDKRGRKRTSDDPYLPETGLREPSVCQSCHALYRQKRWQLDPQEVKRLETSSEVYWVTCPGCQKAAENYPEGILTLRGDYLWNHEQEIRNILTNETERVTARNPVARIMQVTAVEDALVIETTEQKLAEHLGRALSRAHSGDLQVEWSGAPRICRVNWERWQ
ncbi:MAG: BCAM0308 family protein [Desulfuromonadales bacterium]|nr:BCAM0308 family protein [Desulfuromonadales bacterium]